MNEDILALAKLRFEDLLTFFGVNTSVQVEEDGNVIELAADTEANNRLIGHRGENMRALQHLLNMMVRARVDENVYVSIDIAGYKKARAEVLEAKARAYADKVLSTGEELKLRPMSAADRRAIHMALSKISEITTESEGEEPYRRIVIKKQAE